MPVSEEYAAYVVEQLQGLGDITTRRMFSGIGIYSDATFFALMFRDTLYFKVDDENRGDFLKRGMQAFRPSSEVEMSYFEVPADALEDPEELTAWGRRAIDAALRARKNPVKRKPVKTAKVSLARRKSAAKKKTKR